MLLAERSSITPAGTLTLPVPACNVSEEAPVVLPIVISLAVASVPKLIFPVPVFKAKVPSVVVIVLPPVPVFILTVVAPVVLPIVSVFAAASVPRLIAPVPVFKAKAASMVVNMLPPEPALILTAVAPVVLPKVIVLAAASAPKLSVPVPVCILKSLLSVVPKTEAAPGAFPPTIQLAPALTNAIVPSASGNVYVLVLPAVMLPSSNCACRELSPLSCRVRALSI